MPTTEQLQQILRDQFGFADFRPGQLTAINNLLEHKRLLCILPTGYGKSLLYQLPATFLDGVCIVISPLLALMRDQLLHLNQRFQIPAASLNSDQSDAENEKTRHLAQQNKLKILFIAPEQLDNIERMQFLLTLPINLIVIDEAHCISTWGHDFRPSYRQIIQLTNILQEKNPQLHVLGLTATANEKTETDITQQLTTAEQPLQVQRASMDRPNIQLSILRPASFAEKLEMVCRLVQQLPGCGLIYCATRENTELVAEALQNKQLNVAAYHAGFESEHKRQLQTDFVNNKYKAISATNALGMGIDKADLRFVIHFNIPGSITAYYQEVGRCGRDGKPAQGILLFDSADERIQQYFIDSAQPSLADFELILTTMQTAELALSLTQIRRDSGLHPTLVTVIIAELVEQGYLTKQSSQRKQVYCLTEKQSSPELSRYENQYRSKTKELKIMLRYSQQQQTCLMVALRLSLGDKETEPCQHCIICKPVTPLKIPKEDIEMTRFWLNSRSAIIKPARTDDISSGVALLDSKLRSNLFINFMRNRSDPNDEQMMLSEQLMRHMQALLTAFKKHHQFGCLIPIPSRTWAGRSHLSQLIATELAVPSLLDLLEWRQLPEARQGELHNNDQRKFNVNKRMTHNKNLNLPTGDILLFDDYIGSGATVKEAARVLRREAGLTGKIIPFTIASVKWRLGQRGML